MKKTLETKTAMVIVFLSISSAFLAGGFIAWHYNMLHPTKINNICVFHCWSSLMVIPVCNLKYKIFQPIINSI